jgi:hypothetical protein
MGGAPARLSAPAMATATAADGDEGRIRRLGSPPAPFLLDETSGVGFGCGVRGLGALPSTCHCARRGKGGICLFRALAEGKDDGGMEVWPTWKRRSLRMADVVVIWPLSGR